MFTHSINCPYCNSKITEDWSDYITSSDVIDENRQMGAEIEHSIECDEYKCPDCKKTFSVFGSVWEYPEGAYNYHELNTEPLEDEDDDN